MRKLLFLFICITALVTFSCTPTPKKTDISGSRIVFISKVREGDYWDVVKTGAEAAAKEFNISLELLSTDNETKIADQIRLAEEALEKNAAALVLAPNDYYALAEVVEKAYEKKIPVIIIESEINTDKYHCFIGTDNYEAGREAGEQLVKAVERKGKVAIIGNVRTTGNESDREKGLMGVLSKYPEVEIVATESLIMENKTGEFITEKLLGQHPDLEGIVALNAPAAEGAAEVLYREKSSEKVKLITFDSTIKEIEMMEKGAINTTIVQNPFSMGYMAVKNAASALKGETVEKQINTKVTVIDKENMYTVENQKLLFPFVR